MPTKAEKTLYTSIMLALLFGVAWFSWHASQSYTGTFRPTVTAQPPIDEQVLSYLGRYTDRLAAFISNPSMAADIVELSREMTALSSEQLEAINLGWHSDEESRRREIALINNSVSLRLQRYKNDDPFFQHILITDRNGTSIAQTGQTDRFHYGNESWWKEAWAKTTGEAGDVRVGKLEYSPLTRSIAVPVTIIIRDQSGEPQALLRALVGLDELKRVL
jgi:hypothetical protein